jgi:pimeloyl-ACP methyl ester carboxylesterase
MLARLQQAMVVNMVLVMSIWTLLTWGHSPAVAVVGLLVFSLGHSAFLALEFVAIYRLNRHDPAPRAGILMLARAWIVEALTAPRVFVWQQPFRWDAVPDVLSPEAVVRGRRGVVFIHGFVCNRGFWNPWLFDLRKRGHAFAAVSLEPVFGSIEEYVPVVEAAVQQVTAATGVPPVLICHSMGGLAARAWLRAREADARVHRVITIGTPHHGTWLGRFSPTANGQQMALHSAWLQQLALDEPPQRSQLFTCYYSNCDNIVFPTSVATLPGADNRLVTGVPHVALGFDKRLMSESLAMVGVSAGG